MRKKNESINGLVGENETLQMKYNEKLSCNKNLYSENNCLGKEIELKEAQICEMNTKLNNLMTSINVNEAETINGCPITQRSQVIIKQKTE